MLKSLKNKLKRAKAEATRVPRELKDIQVDYQKLTAAAGQTQYQIFAYKQELERLNKQLESVNYEAAARQKMDSEAKEQPAEQKAE